MKEDIVISVTQKEIDVWSRINKQYWKIERTWGNSRNPACLALKRQLRSQNICIFTNCIYVEHAHYTIEDNVSRYLRDIRDFGVSWKP